MNNQSKRYKKITRRLRAKMINKTPLIHLLINAKSHSYNFGKIYFYSKEVKEILLSNAYEWEYGKRSRILSIFGKDCYAPIRFSSQVGFKTFAVNGRFYSENPNETDLPF